MRTFLIGQGFGGGLFDRLAGWRASLSRSRRATRDFASLATFNDRMLSDIGLWRERRPAHRRDSMRF